MRKHLIESYLRQLEASLGTVKKPIEEEELQALYDAKDYVGMILHIKRNLRLDMKVSLGLVNSGGPPKAPAWVAIPETMPAYGTAAFRQTTALIHIRRSFLQDATFEEVVLVIAHEFCHVILDAIGHPLHRVEEAVDLTAMLLGFRDFYVTGCYSAQKAEDQSGSRSEEEIYYEVTQNGYLSREEVRHAAMFMTYG